MIIHARPRNSVKKISELPKKETSELIIEPPLAEESKEEVKKVEKFVRPKFSGLVPEELEKNN